MKTKLHTINTPNGAHMTLFDDWSIETCAGETDQYGAAFDARPLLYTLQREMMDELQMLRDFAEKTVTAAGVTISLASELEKFKGDGSDD